MRCRATEQTGEEVSRERRSVDKSVFVEQANLRRVDLTVPDSLDLLPSQLPAPTK